MNKTGKRRKCAGHFRRKIERSFGNNAINICEYSNRSLLFAVVELGRREEGKIGRRFSFEAPFCRLIII